MPTQQVKPIDASEAGIIDHYDTKRWAIRLAVEAAMTVPLRASLTRVGWSGSGVFFGKRLGHVGFRSSTQ